jgi:hypothetical protein
MMSAETVDAIEIIHEKIRRTTDNYWLERYERALDECLENNNRDLPAQFLVRSGIANARKAMLVRDRKVPTIAFELVGEDVAGPSVPFDMINIAVSLSTDARLTPVDRATLHRLAAGDDAPTIAATTHIPAQRARQRVRAARGRAAEVLGIAKTPTEGTNR